LIELSVAKVAAASMTGTILCPRKKDKNVLQRCMECQRGLTLLRWGEKWLHYFEANVFIRYIKFHQNRSSFVEDNTKNILVSFFLQAVRKTL